MHSSARTASRSLMRVSAAQRSAPLLQRFTPILSNTSAGPSVSSFPRRHFAASSAPTPVPFLYSGPLSLVRQSAPAFTATAVINKEFKPVSLSQYKGKWVVLFFYPLDFTFVCPTEIIAFSDRAAEFSSLNAQLLTASTDSEYSHLAWINTPRDNGGLGDIRIPMIADVTKSISAAYGVLLPELGYSLRGLFIIDPQGKVRQATVNDTPIGRSVDETLRLLKAFQFHEKHGEVCPADWQEGSATMTADPIASRTYFKKVNKT